MNFTKKASRLRQWIICLLASMSMVIVSSLASAAPPQLGESYGGGVVVYVDASGQHGLVAAKADITGHSFQKEEGFFNWYGAKDAANAFVEGYSDWFLPNKEQLHQLYLNRSFLVGIGNTVYWSTSEGDEESAWAENFATGERLVGNKKNGSRVRAIRFF